MHNLDGVINNLRRLLASGTPESPVDIHWQNETLKFVVNELLEVEPGLTLNAYTNAMGYGLK